MKPWTGPFVIVLVLALLATSLVAEAQQAGKVYRIGYLGSTPPTPETAYLWQPFVDGLREHGYVEGQNIIIERRYSKGRTERFSALAAELVRLRVDVLVAVAAPATNAARAATTKIPIVSVAVQDPVGLGFAQSLARPGGNITGPTLTAGLAIAGKQLELLKETVPKISHVAVLWNPGNLMLRQVLRETEVAAQKLQLQLQPLGVRGPDEFDSAFSAIIQRHADALLVLADPMFFGQRTRLADFAAKNRLPALYGLTAHVEAGGLMAYGASIPDLFRSAADYVDKLLKGANPAELPMEEPSKFELTINMKTARALGLIIPRSMLMRADQVIE